MNNQAVRLGVDIGGTFTDVVLEVGAAQYSSKVLTTYASGTSDYRRNTSSMCKS